MMMTMVSDTEVSFVSSKINASQLKWADFNCLPEMAQGKKQRNPLVR